MGQSSFVRSAGVISACTLLSRVLGMARDVLCSHFFGASLAWSAFVVAFRLPNLFRRLFGEGALTAAFLPAFVERYDSGRKDEAHKLFNNLVTALALFLTLVALLGAAATYLPFRDPKTLEIARLLRLMMPYLVLICVTAILGAALNGMRRYFVPAFAPVLLNIAWIVPLFIWVRNIDAVAWSVVAGGALQLLVMVPPLRRSGVPFRPRLDLKDPALREVGRGFFPVVLGLSLAQINEFVGSLIAARCIPDDGAVSWIYYGNQLTQLPLALIGTAMATAVFPLFASPKEDFAAVFQKSLRLVLFVAVPATVGLIVLARPIVSLLFEHGRFKAADTLRTTGVVTFYTLGLWCYCANHIQVRAFYARKDNRTPMRVSAAMVFLNLGLNLALVGTLGERGIALSNSITGLVTFLALNALLRKRHGRVDLKPVYRSFARSVAASALMGAAVWGAYRLLASHGGDTILRKAAVVFPSIGVGAVVYFVAARLFRMEEARELFRRSHENR